MKPSEILLSIVHFRTLKEGFFNLVITAFSFITGYYGSLVLDNVNLFMAITTVVVVDWGFGTAVAIKENIWETQKALKVIYYQISYTTILAMVLSIEKGYPSAFWLTETIIMPILVFQTVSIVKNAGLLGLIPKGLLTEILDKIDRYKNQNIKAKNIEVIDEINENQES
jgi:phage-related holin